MGNFTFSHINQQDDLYKTKTASEIKAALDSQSNELKVVLNNLIDSLQSQVADNSGAENIGIQSITGVTGANVQSALEDLRLQINAAVAGSIPDGSITQAKLAFQIASDDTAVTVIDANNHFTENKLNGVLDELFTSANSVKTNVSGAIGSPSTVNDTGSQLAGYITTEKGRIASNVGDGSSADTLKYLVDRLNVRLDELATNVNAKGVASTSADTLAQLVTKVGLIPAGKRFASGTVTSSAATTIFKYLSDANVAMYSVVVSGLSFKPSHVYLFRAPSTTEISLYNENNAEIYPKSVKLETFGNASGGGTSHHIKGDIAPATVQNGGFTLPVTNGNVTFNWVAFE